MNQDPNIGLFRKTTLTRMIAFTGENAEEVRRFCRDVAAEHGKPWGLAERADFKAHSITRKSSHYRSHGLGPCPVHGGWVVDSEARYPDAAVYDFLHESWTPLWKGDHVAAGPLGECYPVAAAVHSATYERVDGHE